MPTMPNTPSMTNPNSYTISATLGNSTSAIRIDDSTTSLRKTWSSARISSYAQPSEAQNVYAFTSKYGDIYLSDYDELSYDEWTKVVNDAIKALRNGETFYVAWSETRAAQVLNADSDSEPRMTVLIDGQAYAVTDVGLQEVPLYNIVLQFDARAGFPETGAKDRLYIDRSTDALYYWKPGVGYSAITASAVLHTLTFGAGEQYKYNGSEDVTVPVYLGTIR